jgi:tRNA (guanine-N7-)-methyltransferase
MTTTTVLRKMSSYTLPWPVNWQVVFDESLPRPLILEIGFGYGQFLRHLHRQHPHAWIVGVEINNFCLNKMEKAIARDEMRNVRVVHSRAETALHHLFTPGSLSQVHVNFPDPWFKERHAGRRLMQRDTLDAVVSRLTPGGMFYLATDIIAYAEMSAQLLAETPGLSNTHESPWVSSLPGRVVTKYEKKARQEGRDCYFFAYRRNDAPAPYVPVIEELPMPHMVINTPLNLDEMRARFSVQDYHEGETHIKFMESFQGDDAVLFEVYIREPTIGQRVAVVLAKREQPDEYTIKLSALGNPRPTDGLHKAVRLAGECVLGLHPQATVIHDKVRGERRP